MRPICLTLKNLGPYEDQTIHFDRLEHAKTFLIAGPTGSGKTTIFDAITFALYGSGASDDRDVESMRSDFADPNEPTEVDFTFEHQGLVYHIIRKPKQTLNKKRGSGQKEYGSEGVLDIYKHDQKIDEIKRLREINLKIESVLQINREQFVQVILLPQGDFQHFLLAPSSEKESVLRKIFKTQLYQRWADFLNDMKKQQGKQYLDWQNDIQKSLDNVQWLSDFKPGAKTIDDQQIKLLKHQQKHVQNQLAHKKKQLQTMRDQAARAKQRLEHDQQINQQIDDLNQSKQKLQSLNHQSKDYDQLSNQIQNLKWAQQLKPSYERNEDLKRQLKQHQSQLNQTDQDLSDAQKNQKDVQTKADQLEKQKTNQEKLQNERAVLTKERPSFEQMDQLKQQVKNADESLAQSQSKVKMLRTNLDDLTTEDQKLTDAIKQQPQIQTDLYLAQQKQRDLERSKKDLKHLFDLQSQLDDLNQRIKINQSDLKRVQKLVSSRKKRADELHQQQLQGQIVNLVQQLKPGTPCPICGSKQHPLPAHVQQIEPVADKAVKAADQNLSNAHDQQSQLTTQIKERQEQQKQLTNQLSDGLNALLTAMKNLQIKPDSRELVSIQSDLRKASETNDKSLKHVQSKLNQIKQQQTQHENDQHHITEQKETLDQAQKQLQSAQNEAQKYQVRLSDVKHNLPNGFPDIQALDHRLADLNQQIDDYQQAVDANHQKLHQIETTIASLAATKTSLEEQIKNSHDEQQNVSNQLKQAVHDHQSIDQIGTLIDLIHQVDQLDRKEKQLEEYQNQVQKLQAEIKAQANAIGAHDKIDLKHDQKQIDHLSEQLNQFENDYDQQNQRFTLNDATSKQIQNDLSQINKHADKIHQLDLLVTTVTGNNDVKLGLERYVLRAELIRILAAANHHFKSLSSGRYVFALHSSSGAYQKNTGLEVDVYDDDVGKRRSVHTLSGGEKFIASLSLALALGEVIQEESGGINIDTLFIDEGFGSLDRESLDVAMNTLDRLNGEHQMIGIISHVESLQSRIPYQIRVHKQIDGKSTAKIVTPETAH
ncbi:nuclease SbcCD subunit C [Philodulcilactobacillus myokoensis]|uniref:Nuclease SbcCD subunit C n=1 Tax=Philodulcilactobacillus myokoensis TaxID=2929573 RepID=A0A9W6ERP8_9LACO|nr:SMC family ATPase [Philodulcilactobacillus myokoensis]GLB46220.1 nuclease SbcCD subunit C [Philodulcilactobacillus myokoensis]